MERGHRRTPQMHHPSWRHTAKAWTETNLLSTLLDPAAVLWPASFLSVPRLNTSSDLLVINP